MRICLFLKKLVFPTSKCHIKSVLVLLGSLLLVAVPFSASRSLASDLLEMSLEELLKVQVTSVSKGPQSLLQAAAAIYVIDQEDIQRSGASSVPELLKMVPGMHVAQLDANRWAISARGLNGQFANKLLVMIDGRSVYTPIFSGTYWDVMDIGLAEIERIEVIRGPGAALWGANAVNGIINIITLSAEQSEGAKLISWLGTEERAGLNLLQSQQLGADDYLRLSAKAYHRDSSSLSGGDADDDMTSGRLGFRWDHAGLQWRGKTTGSFYQGREGGHYDRATYSGSYRARFAADTDVHGAHLLTNWQRWLSARGRFSTQFYYDFSRREEPFYEAEMQVFDLEMQYVYTFDSGQKLSFGGNLRAYFDDLVAIEPAQMDADPTEKEYRLYSFYLQDEYPLLDDLTLILGSKFEKNDFTGWEVQPNLRVLWQPTDRLSLWGAVSKAVRTPSRLDAEGQILVEFYPPFSAQNPTALPGFYYLDGSSSYLSERLLAYEVGFRQLLNDRLSLDVALFCNDYDRLRTADYPSTEVVLVGGIPTSLKLTGPANNTLHGKSYGAEAFLQWQVLEPWKLIGSYSFMQLDFAFTGELETYLNSSYYQHQASLQSRYDISDAVQVDAWLTYTDGIAVQNQPEIWDLSLRFGWRPRPQWQVELIGQHLLHEQQRQSESEIISMVSTEIERSALLKVTYRF